MDREICRALSPWRSPFFPSVPLDGAPSSRHTTNKTGELAETAAGVRGILFLAHPGRAPPYLVRGFEPCTNHKAPSYRPRVKILVESWHDER